MASPKAPGQPSLPPMTDPDNVQEVYSNDVVVQIRDGGVQLVFSSIAPCDSDMAGNTVSRRTIRSRVTLTLQVANAMVECIRQVTTAMKQHQAVAGLVTTDKPN